MELVIKNYGKALLELLAVGLLAVFLFSTVTDDAGRRGIWNIIGAGLETGQTDYSTYRDFTVYMEESAKVAPEFLYDASVTMKTGKHAVTDYIKAVDYAGSEIPVKLLGIQNPDGIEIAGAYNPDNAEIEFTQTGIYVIELSAADDRNKKTVCRIRVPVNR